MKNDRGFSLIELVVLVVTLGIVAAIALPLLLPDADPVAPAAPEKSSVLSVTDAGKKGRYLVTVEHDGHLFVLHSSGFGNHAVGGILHHPDCGCLSVTEDQ